jgi:hypothetical protein
MRRSGILDEPELPVRAYFLWVGSALTLLLLAADWALPAPLPSRVSASHSTLPPIRIHTEMKVPDGVVMDTSGFGLRTARAEDDIIVCKRPKPQSRARRRHPICAFAKAWRSCLLTFKTTRTKPTALATSRYEVEGPFKRGSQSSGWLDILLSKPALVTEFRRVVSASLPIRLGTELSHRSCLNERKDLPCQRCSCSPSCFVPSP